jgi:hypothetical protein
MALVAADLAGVDPPLPEGVLGAGAEGAPLAAWGVAVLLPFAGNSALGPFFGISFVGASLGVPGPSAAAGVCTTLQSSAFGFLSVGDATPRAPWASPFSGSARLPMATGDSGAIASSGAGILRAPA